MSELPLIGYLGGGVGREAINKTSKSYCSPKSLMLFQRIKGQVEYYYCDLLQDSSGENTGVLCIKDSIIYLVMQPKLNKPMASCAKEVVSTICKCTLKANIHGLSRELAQGLALWRNLGTTL